MATSDGAVGEVVVSIRVDTSELEKGSILAKKKVDDISGSFEKSALQVVKWGAAVAAAAGAAGVAMTKMSLDAIDATAKLARELDTTTESLGTMRVAASYAGISSSELETYLRKLNATIGDGISGNEAVRKTFDRLGLSLVEIAKLPVDQKIVKISEAMRGLGSGAERASALQDLFGRGGMRMSEIMQGGAEAIRAAANEAERYGIAVSAIEARQVEQANDAWERVKNTLGGFFNQVAIKLAPGIQAVADKLMAASAQGDKFGKIIDAAFSFGLNVVGTFKSAMDSVGIIILALRTQLAAVGVGFAYINDAATKTFETIANKGIKAVAGMSTVWNDFVSATQALPGGGLGDSLKVGIIEPLSLTADATINAKNEFLNMADALKTAMAEFRTPWEYADAMGASYDALAEKARNAATAAESASQAMLGGGEIKLQKTDAEKAAEEKAAKELADHRKQLNDKLTALIESQQTELQLEVEKRDTEQKLLEDALANKLITEQDYRDMLEEVEFNHVGKMHDIRASGMTELEKIGAASWDEQAKYAVGKIAEMTADVAQGNKAMFAINKVAAIAQAVMDTHKAASGAYAWGNEIGGPPFGAAMSALAWASGLMRVNAIRAQSYGGGESGGSGSPATSSTATPKSESSASSGAASDKGAFVQINLQGGNLYSGDQVKGLIAALNEQIDNGARIRGINIS